MQVEVKVPQLSESVSEATLVAWRKKPGEAVKRDENLIDIETDKVVLELPAPVDGVISKLVKNDGDSVTSGEVIAVIDTEAAAAAGPAKSNGGAAASAVAPAQATSAAGAARATADVPPAQAGAHGSASPAAKKIAAEKGIDTASVQGTGRDGRVTKADVMGAQAGAPASA